MHYKKIYDFTDDINPLGTSKRVKNSLRKSIKHIESYNEPSVFRFIRYLERLFHIKEENILLGHGFNHIFFSVLKRLKRKKILIPSPVSNSYRIFTEGGDIEILPYKTDIKDDNYCNIKELSQLFDKVDLIILPNPHNITGKILNNKQLDEIINLAEDMKKTVIIDESLIDYTDIPAYGEHIVRKDYSLIIRTFSTYHGLAGLPFGYAIGPAVFMKDLKKIIYPFSFETSPLACSSALVSMKDTRYKKRTYEYIGLEKAYIKERLKNYKEIRVIDRGCNFLILELEEKKDTLLDFFYKKGINIDIYEESDRLFVRLPIKKHRFNAHFVKTLKNMIGEAG